MHTPEQAASGLRRQAHEALRAGRLDEALARLGQACALAPASAALRCELGCVLAQAGRENDALEAFRACVAMAPDFADGWHFLGLTLGRLGRRREALPALRRAHALAPDNTRSLALLASAEFAAGEPVDALPAWRELHRRQPDDLDTQLRLGEVLNRLGDAEGACAHYRSALERTPGRAALWMALAQAEEITGRRPAAADAYRRALALQRGWVPPLAGLLGLQRGQAEPALVAQAQALLDDDGLGDADLAQLGYELGKVHDARGEPARALAAWDLANAARRREAGEPDVAALEARVEASLATFDAERLATHRGLGDPDPRPVFIVGMPRSGTTLLERLLAAHPAVHGAGELPDLLAIARDLPVRRGQSARWPHLPEDFDPAWVAPAARRYLAALGRNAPADARRIVDKFPHNYHALGLAALMLPGARVIWCRRDPRDIAVSVYGENFAPAETLATTWDGIGHLVRLQERMMRHWQAVLPLPVLELHYEALVREPEAEVRRVLAFCGLDWDPACLEFHRGDAAVQTPSRWQVREPVHTRSIGRWKPYASAMAPLLAALGRDPDAPG